jgi:hypothetical protein
LQRQTVKTHRQIKSIRAHIISNAITNNNKCSHCMIDDVLEVQSTSTHTQTYLTRYSPISDETIKEIYDPYSTNAIVLLNSLDGIISSDPNPQWQLRMTTESFDKCTTYAIPSPSYKPSFQIVNMATHMIEYNHDAIRMCRRCENLSTVGCEIYVGCFYCSACLVKVQDEQVPKRCYDKQCPPSTPSSPKYLTSFIAMKSNVRRQFYACQKHGIHIPQDHNTTIDAIATVTHVHIY